MVAIRTTLGSTGTTFGHRKWMKVVPYYFQQICPIGPTFENMLQIQVCDNKKVFNLKKSLLTSLAIYSSSFKFLISITQFVHFKSRPNSTRQWIQRL